MMNISLLLACLLSGFAIQDELPETVEGLLEVIESEPLAIPPNRNALWQFTAAIESRTQVEIAIIWSSLGSAGITRRSEFPHAGRFASTSIALSTVLDARSLEWTLVDDVILITSRIDAPLDVRVYRFNDPNADREEFVNKLHGSATESWRSMGGTGEARIVGNKLVVAQTTANHFKIADQFSSEITRVPAPLVPRVDGLEAIEKLSERTAVEFFSDPLEDCLQFLNEKHGVSLSVDARALKADGRAWPLVTDATLMHCSLLGCLRVLCAQHDLSLALSDAGTIIFTTPESADANRRSIRYDVSHIDGETAASISESLRVVIASSSWSESREDIRTIDDDTIEITQTLDRHVQIARLIESLRSHAE